MKPIQTFRDGSIGLSVWERTGKRGAFYEFTLSRSYKNGDGKSAYSGSFRHYDAEPLSALIQQAAEFIRTRTTESAADNGSDDRTAETTTPSQDVMTNDSKAP